ncbi:MULTISPECIES: RidA family protein [Chromohalobacter]|jgi:enamine deaminase RidA (YjgF/YER057c/UK114 family)|uniref:RidA family protein n=1 Tax=Chromohalobacter TaxID=42054 RepID=UPI000D715BAD|nr:MULTISPECIES: RidA family protein [Chromohalobacter]MBZ5875931.1 RidA family protein [Chromohalobacter salexigens]MDO0945972.1 RidA family protein [Chromohalobacter salexigens]NQY45076.1 RidA family protein [Chromohalobacter sp.]PWW42485.1 enamine deaminase RidA (YjgF/YER057c/UK114 family) [Chromohalobacter salexigens]
MIIQRHDTKARMSRAVIHNGVAYLCGQVAGPEARHGDITAQTESMLARVDALLEEIGSDRSHLLTATVYLSSGDDVAAMNAVWDAWVPTGHAPARTCVVAPMPADELKVEVTVTAAVKGQA